MKYFSIELTRGDPTYAEGARSPASSPLPSASGTSSRLPVLGDPDVVWTGKAGPEQHAWVSIGLGYIHTDLHPKYIPDASRAQI